MRRTLILLLLILLAVGACAESEQAPAPSPAPTTAASPAPPATLVPSTVLPSATALAASPTVTLAPTPAGAESAPTSAEAETAPAEATAHPGPSVPSPWPAPIRELDLGVPAGNGYSPRALGVHSGLGRLYVRTNTRGDYPAAGLVTVMDLATGEVLEVVETGTDSFSEGGLVVDALHDRVYVANPGDSTATVLDAGNLESVATLEDVVLLALAAGGDRLYVAGTESLRGYDVVTGELLVESPLPQGQKLLALDVDPAASRVYLAQQDFDGYRMGVYDALTLDSVATVPLPGRPDALLADPDRGHVYVATNDADRHLLWILDSGGKLVEELPLGDWLQTNYLALDGEGGRLFLGRDDYGNHGISVLDLDTLEEIADIPLEYGPQALAWDGDAQMLYASHPYANQIIAIDPETLRVSGPFPTAVELVDLEVDPQRGHVFLTDSAGRLHVLDSDSDDLLAVLPAEGFISVDVPHGRLYTGGAGADRVRIFDGEALQQSGEIQSKAMPVADAYNGGLYLVRQGIYIASLETLTTTAVISDTLPQNPGFSPNPTAMGAEVDAGSGRVFAIISNGVPGSNGGTYLYVYEPETYQRTMADTERSPWHVDVDPVTGRAYVSRVHMTSRSTSIVEEGREYSARLDSVYGALRVDPDLERVYLTVRGDDMGQMLILDTENLDVLGSVPIPGDFTIRALDPARHWLYLATEAGQVQIWSATGGSPPPATEPVLADLAAEGAYRLYVPTGGDRLFALDGSYALYRSDDQGKSWMSVGGGLPDEWVMDLVFAPDFPQDPTLFAAQATAEQGYGVWMSPDGGNSWGMASKGLTDLAVTDLAISPAFADDGTLFAAARRGGLYRSTDAGESWVPLSDRYLAEDAYSDQPGEIFVSPTYSEDQTLFVYHSGLQRSTDGGETWTGVPGPHQVVFSPAFASDGTLFGWTSKGGVLQSTDGGDTWTGASTGLLVPDSGAGRVTIAPDYDTSETLYLTWLFTSSETPPLYRSTDGGATWEQPREPLEAATQIVLSADGSALLALDDDARLVRWNVSDLDWQPSSLPPLDEIPVDHLAQSPSFFMDQTLVAFSEGAGVLRSEDAGLTWSDTGFPVRFQMLYGVSAGLQFTPPDRLWTGTPVGLYRSDGGGPWTVVGGGLGAGTSTSSPVIGPDGSLRVLAGRDTVHVSTDGGDTWNQPLSLLPYGVDEDGLFLSPALATDRTAFVSVPWEQPQRSIGGAAWEEFGPPGDWCPREFHLSPAFDRDGLMFLVLDDGSLWRSMGAPGSEGMMPGDRWTEIPPPKAGVSLDNLVFSWAYEQDGVMLARGDGVLYRSTDAGTTWTPVLDLGMSYISLEFAPGYETSGEILIQQRGTLYRSDDRGQTWGVLPPPPWAANDQVDLLYSPNYYEDRVVLAWAGGGRYQSDDGGYSWQDIGAGLPEGAIRQVIFSPEYGTDGRIYLVPWEAGVYKRVGDSPWMPVTVSGPPATPEAAATPTATPRRPPAPAPLPTATSTAGGVEPDRFYAVWQGARDQMGVPVGLAEQIFLAEQPFERGTMIWDSTGPVVYVLLETGTWEAYDDTYVEGVDPAFDAGLLPPPQQPQRGFGKVWREELGGSASEIGWALEGERGVEGWRQPFEQALLLWTDAVAEGSLEAGTAYVLYDDGTWFAVSAPGR